MKIVVLRKCVTVTCFKSVKSNEVPSKMVYLFQASKHQQTLFSYLAQRSRDEKYTLKTVNVPHWPKSKTQRKDERPCMMWSVHEKTIINNWTVRYHIATLWYEEKQQTRCPRDVNINNNNCDLVADDDGQEPAISGVRTSTSLALRSWMEQRK